MAKKQLSYLEQELVDFEKRLKESRKQNKVNRGRNPTLGEMIKSAKESYKEEQKKKS